MSDEKKDFRETWGPFWRLRFWWWAIVWAHEEIEKAMIREELATREVARLTNALSAIAGQTREAEVQAIAREAINPGDRWVSHTTQEAKAA
jgi:hypothetical protein